MNYIDTINGYRIYEYDRKTCDRYGLSFPCFGAIPDYAINITPDYEECSMDDLDELMEWCENN